jgi:regulator of protease activity HflC (stomatin/prohibitin superfamily)
MELLTAGLAITVAYLFASLRVIRQYERGVAFFLGRYWGTKGPGLIFLPALFAGQRRVSLRIVAMDIPPQDVITRDNVSVKVNAVLYMRVTDPAKAVIEIEDYLYATSQLAQTTLRSVLGEVELDELLSDREKINGVLKKIIDERTDPWGIEVSAVEVKDVDLPDQMKRAMARQAEAERERRAKVIAAQGELQASETLAQAAKTLALEPNSMQLRYLQTVTEIAAENNSTTIFPIPMELFRPWAQATGAPPARPAAAAPASTPALTPGEPSAALPPEIRKVLAPSVVAEGGIPHDALADMMQQLRVQWAQRDPGASSGEHG